MIRVIRVTIIIADCPYMLFISSIERSARLSYVFSGQSIYISFTISQFSPTFLFLGGILIYFI
jgi:hypothetical protein